MTDEAAVQHAFLTAHANTTPTTSPAQGSSSSSHKQHATAAAASGGGGRGVEGPVPTEKQARKRAKLVEAAKSLVLQRAREQRPATVTCVGRGGGGVGSV